ncbi:MAG TPA: hypothetical protein VIV07_02230 [Sphingomicrobium sp.]
MTGNSKPAFYRIGIAVAVVAAFLTWWLTIVREDDAYTHAGIAFMLLPLIACVGAFAAGFKAAGMARAMVGVAVMQALLDVAILTAPSAASAPDGLSKTYLASAVFIALWLISAGFFRAAAVAEKSRVAAAG